MDDGLAGWLTLRERADERARSGDLTRLIAEQLDGRGQLNALDLATGKGSNIRYLVRHLPIHRQRWLAVDRSPTLLSQLVGTMFLWAPNRGYDVEREGSGCIIHGHGRECRVEVAERDLGRLQSPDLFTGRDLVTASALLDLVSEAWLRSLATHCRTVNAAALFTITYNGRASCWPKEPEDDFVLELFNRHQRTDKGLGGPAAGPSAVDCALQCFREAGYQVASQPSDWSLGPEDDALQRDLVDGWARAAAEIDAAASGAIAEWRERRVAHLGARRSRIVVGHDDVAAWRPRG